MFCTSCGNKVSEQSAFCTACGAAVNGAAGGAELQQAVANPQPTAPKSTSKLGVTLLIIAGIIAVALIGLAVAGATGALDGLGDLDGRSRTQSTSGSDGGGDADDDSKVSGSEQDGEEADQGDSSSEAMSPGKSYDFLTQQWALIQSTSAGYGDRSSGWLTNSYSPLVTAADSSVRQQLAAEGADWATKFRNIQTALTSAKLDTSFEAERQEQLAIISALVQRADSYAAAAAAAAVNPDEGYWRPYQAPANNLAQTVKDLIAVYTPPVAP